MHMTYVSSGTVFNHCAAIKSDEGDFTPEQISQLNSLTHGFLGITKVTCSKSSRYGNIYLVTNPFGCIPCDPENKMPRMDLARAMARK